MHRNRTIWGTLFILCAIIAGAFGAHALKKYISTDSLQSFETGVRYLMYHGLALLFTGLINPQYIPKWAGISWITGSLLFSGSIFLLSLQQLFGIKLTFLGPVTPFGGLILIIGWIILLVSLLKKPRFES